MSDDCASLPLARLPGEAPFLVVDETGLVVSSNDAVRAMLGLSESALALKYCHRLPMVAAKAQGLQAVAPASPLEAFVLSDSQGASESGPTVFRGGAFALDESVTGRKLTVVLPCPGYRGAPQAGRLSDAVLADIAHAVRTPLFSMVGYLDLLADRHRSISRTELGKIAQTLRQSARWTQHLVDNLLNELRLAAGELNVAQSAVALASLMEDAVILTERLAAGRDARITLLLPSADVKVWVDRNHILQVLVTLLASAMRRVSEGSRIELGSVQVDAHWRVTIHDDSRGLPWWARPYAQDNLLPLGTNVDVALGDLSIAVAGAIVELHGGVIGADCMSSKGNCFWLTLPGLAPDLTSTTMQDAAAEAEMAAVRVTPHIKLNLPDTTS